MDDSPLGGLTPRPYQRVAGALPATPDRENQRPQEPPTMDTTTKKITVSVRDDIQTPRRGDLWETCCSSFPQIEMDADSDIDSGEWTLACGDGISAEAYLGEQDVLRDCIKRLGFTVTGFGTRRWEVSFAVPPTPDRGNDNA